MLRLTFVGETPEGFEKTLIIAEVSSSNELKTLDEFGKDSVLAERRNGELVINLEVLPKECTLLRVRLTD